MSQVNSLIENRRSIRRFTEQDVPSEVLQPVLEAVRWAPSWANTQCWEVVVVRDPDIKAALQESIAPKNPATKAIVSAPVVLGLCGRLKSSGYYQDQVTTKFGDWFMFDLGIAAQNICLQAHDQGLGTVIVGLFDHDRAARILKVPQNHELVCLIPLGWPAKTPPAPKRKDPEAFTHNDTF